MSKGAIPPHLPESNEQNLVVIEAFLEAAKRYVRGGYDVIVDGIVGPWFLEPWLNIVQEHYEVHYMPDDFDIENYTKEVFFMFSGEKVLLDLRCDNSLMKTMVDRFGEDVTTLAYDMTSFRVQTEVSASPTFFGWVFGFNGKVQILAPESVKEQYRQMIAKADEDMQESE